MSKPQLGQKFQVEQCTFLKTKQKLVLKREKDPEKVVKEAPRSVSSNVGICGLQQDCVQGSGSQVISPTNASPLTEEGL